MPVPLSSLEIEQLINEALVATGAEKMADMGKVMAHIKAKTNAKTYRASANLESNKNICLPVIIYS